MSACGTGHRTPTEALFGAVLCESCQKALRGSLRDLETLWPELDEVGQESQSPGVPARQAPGSRPPVRLDVVDITDRRTSPVLRPVLEAAVWVSRCRRLAYEPVGMVDAAQMLQRHADWVASQYEAPQILDAVASAARTVRALTVGNGRLRPYLGRCPQPVDEGTCGGLLAWDGLTLRCQDCRAVWDRQSLVEHGDVYMGSADVAAIVGVPRSTLSAWVRSGRVRSRGRNQVCLSDAVAARAG